MKISIKDSLDTKELLERIVTECVRIGRPDKAAIVAYEVGLRDGGRAHYPALRESPEEARSSLLLVAANCMVDVETIP